MLSDVVRKNLLWSGRRLRLIAMRAVSFAFIEAAAFSHHIRHIRHEKMGNSISACHVSNYSKRTIRVFVTKQPLAIDDVLTSGSKGDDHSSSASSVDKTFSFRADVDGVRMPPSRSYGVKYEPQEYMNVFVEDEDHKDVCSKHIMHNMVKNAPFTVLLYDA